MYIDIVYANGLAFLITHVEPMGHMVTTLLVKTDVPTFRQAIRQHLGRYGQKEIRIREIHSDKEKGITAMAADFSAYDYTSPVQSGNKYLYKDRQSNLTQLLHSCSPKHGNRFE